MLFLSLEKLVHVDSFGKLFNNSPSGPMRGSELDKHMLMQEYKLIISMENSFFPGYNTEKVIQPYAAGCIPIYSGGLDTTIFNQKSMIFAPNFKSLPELSSYIHNVIKSESLWHNILSEPLFINNSIPEQFYPEYIIDWLYPRLVNLLR
jgi:hypothetical protein